MKRIIKVFFFVGFILLSSCSDNTIQEVVLPEEPVAPVDPDPEPGDNNTLPLLRCSRSLSQKRERRDCKPTWIYTDLQSFLQQQCLGKL